MNKDFVFDFQFFRMLYKNLNFITRTYHILDSVKDFLFHIIMHLGSKCKDKYYIAIAMLLIFICLQLFFMNSELEISF